MLVLTRKNAESIRIADDIELFVLAIHGGKVRLGINCPGDVPVHRSEIQERIERLQSQSPKETACSLTMPSPRMGSVPC
jgi:carbon storage regulator